MSRMRLIGCATMAVAITVAMLGGIATLAAPDATPRNDNVAARTDTNAQALGPLVGTFTGEYVDGVPVYRLPGVNVSVSRKAELARMEREERLARAEQERVLAEAGGTAPSRLQPVIAAVSTGQ
jgi:hypothetical protein